MHDYIQKYGAIITKVTKAVLCNSGLDAQEIEDNSKRLAIVCAFLIDQPESLSWRGHSKPSVTTELGILAIATKFFGTRLRKDYPAPPGTKPDEVVSLVLRIVYGYTEKQTEQIKTEHQHSMSAENIVGALLERYIASVMEAHSWVWCAGDFIRAVDFLHLHNGRWTVLQVKNRDNTENSSSSAIRHGTEIEKWFRTFARTGETNWGAFPDPQFRSKLSESGFQSFVEAYLRAAKSS